MKRQTVRNYYYWFDVWSTFGDLFIFEHSTDCNCKWYTNFERTYSVSVPFYLISKVPFDTEITKAGFVAAQKRHSRNVRSICRSPLHLKCRRFFLLFFFFVQKLRCRDGILIDICLKMLRSDRDNLSCILSSATLVVITQV